MASLFRRSGSPYWWLRSKTSGRWANSSTGLRWDSEIETRQAELESARVSLIETERAAAGTGDQWAWVDDYIDQHARSPRTAEAYTLHWRHIRHWLRVTGIRHPREIRFTHGSDYVHFRTTTARGRKTCGRNTALQELKFFGLILRQCALRGEIPANPLHHLGITREPAPEKRELTDTEIQTCIHALQSEPDWMRLTFHIALHTGCRLRETRLRMSLVDFHQMTITFPSPKGGTARAFTRPLPAALLPILQPLAGRTWSHDFPFQPSRAFTGFFQRVGIRGVCVHCLRVTYITRLHRSGVPLAAAMRLVNHSSEAVHRIYRRLQVDDVRRYADVPIFSTNPQNPNAEEISPPSEKYHPQPTTSPSSSSPPAPQPADSE
jgi:integrase